MSNIYQDVKPHTNKCVKSNKCLGFAIYYVCISSKVDVSMGKTWISPAANSSHTSSPPLHFNLTRWPLRLHWMSNSAAAFSFSSSSPVVVSSADSSSKGMMSQLKIQERTAQPQGHYQTLSSAQGTFSFICTMCIHRVSLLTILESRGFSSVHFRLFLRSPDSTGPQKTSLEVN